MNLPMLIVLFLAVVACSVPTLSFAEAVEGTEPSEPPQTEAEPIRLEAELPEGFPQPGPVDEVVLKSYPAYRVATAEGGREAFWTLFQHIKKHDIPMTAPVEMTVDQESENRFSMADMKFMYASTSVGELGEDGRVMVEDIPAAEVLSLGVRGERDDSRGQELLDRIRETLAEMPDYEAAGPPRVMGYHSPMVPAHQRYFEVQLPVRKAVDADEANEKCVNE